MIISSRQPRQRKERERMGEKKKPRLIPLWIIVVGLYVTLIIHCYQEHHQVNQELFQYQERTKVLQEQTKVLREQTESLEKLLAVLQVLQEKKVNQ